MGENEQNYTKNEALDILRGGALMIVSAKPKVGLDILI